ncbi:glycosyltransferase family 2 protein [Polynucleobacter sp. UB-Tiil-W10]|uniref:glycosyltransferase family 2 protein n=1 Tax=Polynucleobacter sp. UB-Tiil-W10 TaxID=1855648 RepID=UPI001C0D2383|nr:glycosyltransferase family 2 protein [Polynucleobacter sp. UB-Tiil-W10]MBU3540809.1 glycosyltransferase family 2 protein [Polynucleobacter sp. UB-Tiil-W10]
MTDFIYKNLNLGLSSDAPLVAILLCTYNGARFLAEQLDSLEDQTHQNWVVIASDDGSTDQTLEILQQYQVKWPAGKLTIRSGPQKGFSQNFLSLACDPEIKADHYAFCDQDDVWLPEKLDIAVGNIVAKQEYKAKKWPYLYCGRTAYISSDKKPLGFSPLFGFPPSFRNALIQSIAGGNTMVFNQKVKDILERVGLVDVASHDWWVYQLTSAADGMVYYDKEPQILYRQHSGALIGGNSTFLARLKRLKMLLKGRFFHWTNQNLIALDRAKVEMSRSNSDVLSLFITMRGAKLKDRFRLIEVCGLYRQTWTGTISLVLAALLNKV